MDKRSFKIHRSSMSTCRVTIANLSTHSLTNSSSHANNFLCHFQASPPTSHPIIFMSAMVTSLFSANSNNLWQLTSRGTPSSHESLQNKVYNPFLTSRFILSTNYPSFTKPSPILLFYQLSHQTDPLLPSKHNWPPSSPYRATNTLYHKFSISFNTLQTHFPSNKILNSFNLLRPKLPFSLSKHKVSHLIQDIFLTSSPPPQFYFFYWK